MGRTNMLKELGLAALLITLASGAVLDDHLPAEHRGGDDDGVLLGPEILEPVADPAADPEGDPAADPSPDPAADSITEPPVEADIEAELETQLRDSLPPGVLMGPPQQVQRYRPVYPAVWPPYPAPYLLPALYSAPARPVGPPVSWYLAPAAAVRGQRPFPYSGLIGAAQPAPSVAASRIYDVTISSAHAPQLPE